MIACMAGKDGTSWSAARGSDRFVFSSTFGTSHVDLISDFKSNDSIQLDNSAFTRFTQLGDLRLSFLRPVRRAMQKTVTTISSTKLIQADSFMTQTAVVQEPRFTLQQSV